MYSILEKERFYQLQKQKPQQKSRAKPASHAKILSRRPSTPPLPNNFFSIHLTHTLMAPNTIALLLSISDIDADSMPKLAQVLF